MDSLIHLLELATHTINSTPLSTINESDLSREEPTVMIRWKNQTKKLPIITQTTSNILINEPKLEEPIIQEAKSKNRKSTPKKLVQPHTSDDSVKPRERYERFREKQFVCEDCGHSFTLKHNLKVHREKYHDGENPREMMCNRRIVCVVCGEVFRTKSEVKKHSIQVHKPKRLEKEKHVCDQCGREYATARQVREHIIAMHLDERLYVCEICGTSFGRPGGLRRHLVMVHTDYTFKCPFEGCTHPGYKCSKALAAHIRSVHTKERPYVCSTCDKSFIRKNDLKVHQETHDPHARFRCDYCDGDFKRQVYYKKHQKRCKYRIDGKKLKQEKQNGDAECVDDQSMDEPVEQMTLNDLIVLADSMNTNDSNDFIPKSELKENDETAMELN